MYQQLHSLLSYGKVVVTRALAAGLSSTENRFASQLPQNASQTQQNVHLLAAVSGYSKSWNTVSCPSKHGYGEDAFFITTHSSGAVMGKQFIVPNSVSRAVC